MEELTAQIVAVTQPRIPGCNTAEKLISYCARVSNPGNQDKYDTAGKLLKYCAEHQHWSIFEMASVVFEIQCPRDIGRQILRHKSFSFQEFSQRYQALTEDAFMIREARLQDTKNRQNSIEIDPLQETGISAWFGEAQEKVRDLSYGIYSEALNLGIAKEQARAVLPEGMTLSKMYMAGTVRSWIHYLQLRTDAATQKEHRLLAERCLTPFLEEFPSLTELFQECPSLTESLEGN